MGSCTLGIVGALVLKLNEKKNLEQMIAQACKFCF